MPDVLLAMSRRMERETTPQQAATLWGATKILMGLRYEEERVDAIIRGSLRDVVRDPRDRGIDGLSGDPPQGRGQGPARAAPRARPGAAPRQAKKILIRLARKRFGPPDAGVERRSPPSRTSIASTISPIACSTSRAGTSCWPRPAIETKLRWGRRTRRRSGSSTGAEFDDAACLSIREAFLGGPPTGRPARFARHRPSGHPRPAGPVPRTLLDVPIRAGRGAFTGVPNGGRPAFVHRPVAGTVVRVP